MSSAPGLQSDASADAVLAFFRQMAGGSAPSMVIEGGGGPERVDVVCGFLGCDVRPFNPVLASLPRLVHLRRAAAVAAQDRLAQILEFALGESRQRRAGAKCVVLRLSEVLFVESEAAFSRAFKKIVGSPPAAWRRSGRSGLENRS